MTTPNNGHELLAEAIKVIAEHHPTAVAFNVETTDQHVDYGFTLSSITLDDGTVLDTEEAIGFDCKDRVTDQIEDIDWRGVINCGYSGWSTVLMDGTSGDLTVVSGPHMPVGTVRHCDVGGEPLTADAKWWLVTGSGNKWVAGRGASCAEHAGQEPIAVTGTVGAPTGYAAAVER